MAVTRDDVIQTAIQLLQEVGLDALTLRRLATELGISAPTLYWHVRGKRELLDLMAEEMVRSHRAKEPPFSPNLDWAGMVEEGFRRQYQALLAYRDGARVVAGNRPTESALPMIERFLGIWVEAGFSPQEALRSILTFSDFVAGSALEYQAEIERQREQAPTTHTDFRKSLEPYPLMREGALGLDKPRHVGNFEHGLRLMMSGLRARHAELMAEKAAQPARPQVSSSVN